MGTEIERKFLVASNAWRTNAGPAVRIRQGYLAVGPPTAVRVRIAGDQATLNVKSATLNISRIEYEYAIPMADAEHILSALAEGYAIEKHRHRVFYSGKVWEVDVFDGVNEGLTVAEIELRSENEPFDVPPWAGEEVSADPRYLNTHLSRKPFSQW